MKIKLVGFVLSLLFLLGFAGTNCAANDFKYPIMPADVWIEAIKAAEAAPEAEIFLEIKEVIDRAAAVGQSTSYSLLNHLDYDPEQRQQGACGNCWVWTGTALMEIAHDVNNAVFDRLSIQYFNSCKTDSFACCGGNLSKLATWYRGQGLAVPWDNSNASYIDGDTSCEDEALTLCASISQTSHYAINSISDTTIPTRKISQATAIANIKTILNSDKAVSFGFALPNTSARENFESFFDCNGGETEESRWNDIDSFCGKKWDENSVAHVVVIYGYNDDDPNPANHYWMVLNSWGIADGNRPNGVFRIPMYFEYDCVYPDPVENVSWRAFSFQTLDIEFAGGNECTTDTDCSDGLFCNGAEACINGVCYYGDWPCEVGESCDETLDQCFCDREWDLNGDCFVDKADTSLLKIRQKLEKIELKIKHKGEKEDIKAHMGRYYEVCGMGYDFNANCVIDKEDAKGLKLWQKGEKTSYKNLHKAEKAAMKAALQ